MTYQEIQGFAIQQLDNKTHFSFGEATLKRAQQDSVVSTRCAKYITPYAAAVKEEDEALVEAKDSTLSGSISDMDKKRDITYDTFLKMVKALNALPNVEMKAKTEKVLRYVKINDVNTSAQYDKESGQITNFIQDMEKYCEQELRDLNLWQLIQDLKQANEEMKRLLAERAEEYSQRILKRVQLARKAVDAAYRTLIKAVNAMAFLDWPEQAVFNPYIGYMNAEITRLKREALKLHVSQKEETGEEGPAITPPSNGDGGTLQPDTDPNNPEGSEGSENNPSTPSTPGTPSNPNNPTDPDDDPDALKPGPGGDDPDL